MMIQPDEKWVWLSKVGAGLVQLQIEGEGRQVEGFLPVSERQVPVLGLDV